MEGAGASLATFLCEAASKAAPTLSASKLGITAWALSRPAVHAQLPVRARVAWKAALREATLRVAADLSWRCVSHIELALRTLGASEGEGDGRSCKGMPLVETLDGNVDPVVAALTKAARRSMDLCSKSRWRATRRLSTCSSKRSTCCSSTRISAQLACSSTRISAQLAAEGLHAQARCCSLALTNAAPRRALMRPFRHDASAAPPPYRQAAAPCPAGRRCGGARGRARSQRQYASMPQGRRLFESVNVTVNFSSNVRPDYVRNQSGAVLRERVTLLRVLHLTKEPANCGVTHKSNRRKKS